jgi:Concanavalin A-like lectin/glucanases superfamily
MSRSKAPAAAGLGGLACLTAARRQSEEAGVAAHQVGLVRSALGPKRWRYGWVLTAALACVIAGLGAQSAFAATTVALWHMNETAGTAMRDSARSHTGSRHNVTLGVPGFSGTAYRFNGSSSYVSVPSASDLNSGTANLTLTIHLKTTSLPPPEDWDLIRKGYSTTRGGEWKVEYYPSGQASCGFAGSGGYAELRTGPSLNNGRWHTIRCVKTSSAIRLIVDGATYSKAASLGSIANSAAIVVGAYPGSEFFKGSLDEASVAIGYHPHACRPIYNLAFLEGSRLEGADIVHVRAHHIRCWTARRVAYAATKRGISLGASVLHYGVRVAGHRWRVDRKLSGAVDRYRARTGSRTVSWRLR